MFFVWYVLLSLIGPSASLDFSKLSTPDSNLKLKCNHLLYDSAYIKGACYVLDSNLSNRADQSKCKQLRGFSGNVASYDKAVINFLELVEVIKGDKIIFSDKNYNDNGGRGKVLCQYHEPYHCDSDYVLEGIWCYKLVNEPTIWSKARDSCKRMKATLAVPHNDEDIQKIGGLVFHNDVVNQMWNRFVWIGMDIPDHKKVVTVDGSSPNYFRWLPLGHKRLLTDAFITPHTAVGFGASASNTDNVAQFGFMQVINGNYHKIPFICQKLAKTENGRPVYVPEAVRSNFPE